MPVTSRDVQFWINLLRAGKTGFWRYKPGEFPDNVTSLKIFSSSRFSLTFDHPYSEQWLYNQLGLIIPSRSTPVERVPEVAADELAEEGDELQWHRAVKTVLAIKKSNLLRSRARPENRLAMLPGRRCRRKNTMIVTPTITNGQDLASVPA